MSYNKKRIKDGFRSFCCMAVVAFWSTLFYMLVRILVYAVDTAKPVFFAKASATGAFDYRQRLFLVVAFGVLLVVHIAIASYCAYHSYCEDFLDFFSSCVILYLLLSIPSLVSLICHKTNAVFDFISLLFCFIDYAALVRFTRRVYQYLSEGRAKEHRWSSIFDELDSEDDEFWNDYDDQKVNNDSEQESEDEHKNKEKLKVKVKVKTARRLPGAGGK